MKLIIKNLHFDKLFHLELPKSVLIKEEAKCVHKRNKLLQCKAGTCPLAQE